MIGYIHIRNNFWDISTLVGLSGHMLSFFISGQGSSESARGLDQEFRQCEVEQPIQEI